MGGLPEWCMWRYQRIDVWGQSKGFWRYSLNILKLSVQAGKNRKGELDIHHIYLVCSIFRGWECTGWWNECFGCSEKVHFGDPTLVHDQDLCSDPSNVIECSIYDQ